MVPWRGELSVILWGAVLSWATHLLAEDAGSTLVSGADQILFEEPVVQFILRLISVRSYGP